MSDSELEVLQLPAVLQRRMARLALSGWGFRTYGTVSGHWTARHDMQLLVISGWSLETLLNKMVGIAEDAA